MLFIDYGQWLCFGFCNQKYFYVYVGQKSVHNKNNVICLNYVYWGKKLVAHLTFKRCYKGTNPNNTSWNCGKGNQVKSTNHSPDQKENLLNSKSPKAWLWMDNGKKYTFANIKPPKYLLVVWLASHILNIQHIFCLRLIHISLTK